MPSAAFCVKMTLGRDSRGNRRGLRVVGGGTNELYPLVQVEAKWGPQPCLQRFAIVRYTYRSTEPFR